ncbi:hypothetical protein NMY22_g11221 [Coprinellus aureogranulatus]|nr:hypothetical protein NMY22_g11221 [Coprinellus aureogranulatus]
MITVPTSSSSSPLQTHQDNRLWPLSTNGNNDDLDNSGPPFLSTLKGISANGSLSFSYRGTWVWLAGSVKPHTSSEDGRRDPDWECFIDGISKGKPFPYPDRPINNFPLCSNSYGEEVGDGNHTLELKAVVHSETLWVDQVQYLASSDVDLSGAWTVVQSNDSRLVYSGDWEELPDQDGYGNATTNNGASVTYNFNGQGLIFVRYTPSRSDPAPFDGRGAYSLDGQPPTEFIIPATFTSSRKPHFSILSMDPGPHRLEVVNKGNSSTAALSFGRIYTQNSPVSVTQPYRCQAKAELLIIVGVGLLWRRQHRRGALVQRGGEYGVVASATVFSEKDTGQSPRASHPQRSQALSTHLPTSDNPPRANHEVGTSTNLTLPGPVSREGEPSSSLFPGEQSSPSAATQGTSLEPGGLPSSTLHYLQTMDGKVDTDDPPAYARDAK